MNCVMLKHAYEIIFDLFTKAGLVLEHNKTELFHFTRARGGFDRALDLGYAPYTGNTPLKPKTFWRYLGFFFDRKLSFQEHLRFYTTKALTTVMAMGMLGNSTRGLTPRNKRILYRACVIPIATYGHRLWFYNGAKNVGALRQLTTMQHKAACWITGAFRTSPTGGVEALAGLPPICIHLRKLSQRAIFRTATLTSTHPLHSLLPGGLRGDAIPHFGATYWLPQGRQGAVRDTITKTLRVLDELTEKFSPSAEEATPGMRLMDRFPGRVLFNPYFPDKEDPHLVRRRNELDGLFEAAKVQPRSVLWNRCFCSQVHSSSSCGCFCYETPRP